MPTARVSCLSNCRAQHAALLAVYVQQPLTHLIVLAVQVFQRDGGSSDDRASSDALLQEALVLAHAKGNTQLAARLLDQAKQNIRDSDTVWLLEVSSAPHVTLCLR